MPNKKIGVDYYAILALLHLILIIYTFFTYNYMIPEGGPDALKSLKNN